jgi:hypothetical protein
VNTYWEHNLPSGFRKPGPSASNSEVVKFMTDKYINKKWVDEKMKHDPLYLFENKREKFDKWLRKKIGAAAVQEESEEEAPVQPKAKKVVSEPVPTVRPIGNIVQPARAPVAAAPMDDLINMKS